MLATITFSRSQASRIVGGQKHLDSLVLQGKVSEIEGKGRLTYNAREVALHAKNYRL